MSHHNSSSIWDRGQSNHSFLILVRYRTVKSCLLMASTKMVPAQTQQRMIVRVAFIAYLASATLGFSPSPAPSGWFLCSSIDTSPTVLTAINTNRNSCLEVVELPKTRRDMIGESLKGAVASVFAAVAPVTLDARSASALSEDVGDSSQLTASASISTADKAIAYRSIPLPVPKFGVEVPVSIWYPIENGGKQFSTSSPPEIKYSYRISLRRIAQLLAKWDFIPEFISKKFALDPSISSASKVRVVDGKDIPIQVASGSANVVFFAHGFLGSRSDLAYIAEDLAAQGFVCVSPEYPESLEASYPRLEGLDRVVINEALIPYVRDLVAQPILSYAAVGHSLGCRTVLKMGDDSWSRVLMGSGKAPEFPSPLRDDQIDASKINNKYHIPAVGGRLLFISSVNDGPVTSWGGGIQIPKEYTVLQESQLDAVARRKATSDGASEPIVDRFALVFDREDAPNHISYLSENVNDAMISFLSPLLPVTQALNIPVLDFDKYATSRDSVPTGKVLKPLISKFLSAAAGPPHTQ